LDEPDVFFRVFRDRARTSSAIRSGSGRSYEKVTTNRAVADELGFTRPGPSWRRIARAVAAHSKK
jgi:hypothetical protein